MLATSPTAAKNGDRAEEWAIHDYDGFGPLRLGEYEALSTIARIANGIAEHGPAFAAWADHVGLRETEQLAEFEDRYQGEWESAEAFAEDMLEQGGAQQIVEQAPVWLQPYLSLNAAGFAHDLQLGGDIITVDRPDGGVWVWSGL